MAITTTGDAGTPNVDQYLVIGNAGNATMTVTGGSTVQSDDGATIARESTSAATVLLSGAGSAWTSGGPGSIGSAVNVGLSGDGTLMVEQGAVMNALDSLPDDGFEDAYFEIGGTGTGAVEIRSGGRLRVEDESMDGSYDGINIGAAAGGSGRLKVTGAGSEVLVRGNSSYVTVGREGSGELSILDGAGLEIHGPSLYATLTVGRTGGGSGRAEISGPGSSVLMEGAYAYLFVGREGGSGELSVLDGGRLEMHALGAPSFVYIGSDDGAAGRVEISGVGSRVLVEGPEAYLVIGDRGGSGELSVLGGGRLELHASGTAAGTESGINIAHRDAAGGNGATGSLEISGADSAVLIEGPEAYMNVGRSGDGTAELSILDGGQLTILGTNNASAISALNIGRDGSTGRAEVSGTGSAALLYGPEAFINIGLGGTGELSVLDGGQIELNGFSTHSGISIGRSGGTGRLDVSGSASAVLIEGAEAYLNVGRGGTGELSILDGGRLELLGTSSWSGVSIGRDGAAGEMLVSGGEVMIAVEPANVSRAYMFIGRESGSPGTLRIENGGTVTVDGADSQSPAIFVGCDIGAEGSLVISGDGSRLDLLGGGSGSPGMVVGEYGMGTLRIEDGGALNLDLAVSGGFAIGGSHFTGTASGTGAATVTGPGSRLLVADPDGAAFSVGGGTNGTGQLTVSNGGQVSVDDGGVSRVSGPEGSVGAVTVQGSGSLWDAGESCLSARNTTSAAAQSSATAATGR